MSIAAVICAAGAGSRMGKNKALCNFGQNDTFLSAIVRTLRVCHVENIVVTTGAQHDEVVQMHRHLDIQWAHNHAWKSTYMLESLVCGLKCIPEHTTVIHWPVDCIGIDPRDLESLIQAPAAPIAVLAWHGIPQHPMRLSPETADRLRHSEHACTSLRAFVEMHTILPIEAQFDALTNCNDPQALAEFLSKSHPHSA